MTLQRSTESENRRQQRLGHNRERNFAARLQESEERSSRLQENRERNVTSRQKESEEERSSRLELRRFNRLAETSEHQQIRLSGIKNATSVSRAREQLSDLKGLAFNYNPLYNYSKHPKVELGKMNVQCRHCHALKWREETPGMCCSNGKVKLSSLQPPPEPLKSLMSEKTTKARHFRQQIRKYNSCFQMTSFGAKKNSRAWVYANC
ncbi:hypothetical protein Bpfe_005782 [Biomphalaria pfeifferi]|uniref:Helitron helicase-like domain-containing protein n=1 Tax=Biomphalaria pfeifferi TaxID=112525 RepID=A0AAD8C1T3_BIOPF|nr:hypothetical protein Bpfe_005782 [Biomphalaria pfeifferi]